MRISDLVPTREDTQYVETTMDSNQVLMSDWDKQNYIGKYGDVEIVNAKTSRGLSGAITHWEVPAHKEKREIYSSAKQRECRRWGCE
jgi:hypothetical protein